MALRRERMRLGDILVKQHVITEEQLKQALDLQKGTGKKIGEVMVDNGIITDDMIVLREDPKAYRYQDITDILKEFQAKEHED